MKWPWSRIRGAQVWFVYTQLLRRDVERRYRGTVAGWTWAVLQPLMMIAIYTLVFGFVFRPRWPGADSAWDYVLILFLGKIPFLLATECFARAAVAIHGHSNLVQKSSLNLDLLPAIGLGTGIFNAVIAVMIWSVTFFLIRGEVPWLMPALVMIWLPVIVFTMGVAWIVAAFGAYFKDTEQIVASLNIALMFLSPIFYPSDSLPELFQGLLALNPLTYAIEEARSLLLFDGRFYIGTWLVHMAVALAVFFAGWVFFRRVRPGFADVV